MNLEQTSLHLKFHLCRFISNSICYWVGRPSTKHFFDSKVDSERAQISSNHFCFLYHQPFTTVYARHFLVQNSNYFVLKFLPHNHLSIENLLNLVTANSQDLSCLKKIQSKHSHHSYYFFALHAKFRGATFIGDFLTIFANSYNSIPYCLRKKDPIARKTC